jgi:probable addiction module antidote protein
MPLVNYSLRMIETFRFDVLEYLKTQEDRLAYLEVAFEDGEPTDIALALRDVVRSIGLTTVANAAGVADKVLDEALSEKGGPRLSILLAVTKALGLQLYVKPANPAAPQ